MIYRISSLKVFDFSIWTQQMFPCSNSTIRTKIEISLQLTIKKLEWRHWHISSVLGSSFLILNSSHTLFLCFSRQLWTRNSLPRQIVSQTKPLKIIFSPFNFDITKICVAIRLAEDGTRMGTQNNYFC